MKTLITAYETPDLDGTASAFAYQELKAKLGEETIWGVFGQPHLEVEFVFDYLGLPIERAESVFDQIDNILLVDSSDTRGISSLIDIKKVIEIIDHRAINEAEKFVNAKAQIEIVGACATLIAEKFIEQKIEPSKEAAIMLYLAIASNTINFKAKVTTERDLKMAEYLKKTAGIDESLIHQMFAYKSKLSGSIKSILEDKIYHDQITGDKVSIFQLEITGVDEFVKNNFSEISDAIQEIKDEQGFDWVLLTCIDLDKGENTFVVVDEKAEELIEDILSVRFEKNVAHLDHIIMRKELIPLIKKYLEAKQ